VTRAEKGSFAGGGLKHLETRELAMTLALFLFSITVAMGARVLCLLSLLLEYLGVTLSNCDFFFGFVFCIYFLCVLNRYYYLMFTSLVHRNFLLIYRRRLSLFR